jgi:hypothetical protein
MPRARDLLERFRPLGAPGPAAPAGVPADRGAELGRELEPVFAALADTLAEAARIRAAGAAEAGGRRARATEQARAVVETARTHADAERAAAAVGLRSRTEAETAATLAAAAREADEITRRVRERLPAQVDRVVAAVRAAVAGPPEDGGP